MVKFIQPKNLDLFIADAFDIRIKKDLALGAENFFSLAKKPRYEPIVHNLPSGKITIEATGGVPIATVFDEDILIYLVSQLVHGKNEYEAGRSKDSISRTITFNAYNLWQFQKKNKQGRSYQELWEALERLYNTRVKVELNRTTKIDEDSYVDEDGEGYIRWLSSITRKTEVMWRSVTDEETGKKVRKRVNWTTGFNVEIPERFFKAVEKNKVITLDDRYFSLKSPLERWLYKFIRKSVGKGKNDNFKYWSFEQLHAKSASTNALPQFKKAVKNIMKKNEMRLFEYTAQFAKSGVMSKHYTGLYFDRNPYVPDQKHKSLLIDGTDTT